MSGGFGGRGRVEELLGLNYPVVQGPFGGGLSTVELASTVAEAGGLGSFGAHLLSPEAIGSTVAAIKGRTARAFAMNLWVPLPGETDVPSAAELAGHVERLRPYLEKLGLPVPDAAFAPGPRFEDQAAAILEAEPPVFSFVMGVPPAWVVDEARRRGMVTIATATTRDEALAIEAAGVDVVVASGSDAGGHRGAFLRPVRESLVGTFALVPQVADAVAIPVVAAGGIADGRGVAAALILGADGVQIGTGFLATHESGASSAHRRMLAGPDSHVTVLTRLFSGRPARMILNRLLSELEPLEDVVAPYPVQSALTLPVRRAAAAGDDPESLNLTSGQAAALSKAQGAADYFAALVAQTRQVLGARSAG